VHQYEDITSDENLLLIWLQELLRTGLTIIRDVPSSLAGLESVTRLVGSVKRTHYGDFWNVRSKAEANNLAYTSASLGLHTDLPYYWHTPGTQFLHCIKQAQGRGGDNVFCDGFSVAERIRADFPAQFELLRISSGDRRIFLPIDILGVISFSQTTNS